MSKTNWDNVQIIILAAGKGKRMNFPLPKVMLPLHGKPLVEHVVDAALGSSCQSSPVVVVSPQSPVISHLGSKVTYAIQEEQLGTAHAVLSAAPDISQSAKHIVVLYGDMPFIRSDSIDRLIETHLHTQATLTMLTAMTPDFLQWRKLFETFGRVVRDSAGDFDCIVEWKDASAKELQIRELSTCYFCFSAQWLWSCLKTLSTNNAQKEYYLGDLLQLAKIQGKNIATAPVALEEAIGINRPEDLKTIEQQHTQKINLRM